MISMNIAVPLNLSCASTSLAAGQKIIERALDNLREIDRRTFDLVTGVGDSPIERLLYLALLFEINTNWRHDIHLMTAVPGTVDSFQLFSDSCIIAVLEMQKQIGEARVDFCLTVRDVFGKSHSLVIECDGHEFHERTKDQAKKDRSRDRLFQSLGHTVYRFTGSEIFNDPCNCANQVIRWIADTVHPAIGDE
jgi:very-short-patch-repair endonuclease